jgi:hypothetical protein
VVDGTQFDGKLGSLTLCILFGKDLRHGDFQTFQRQLELVSSFF